MGRVRHDLIARREWCELTQDDVARALGMDIRSYRRYERGETTPGMARRRQLAAVLHDWPLVDLARALDRTDGAGPSLAHGWFSNFEAFEQSAISISAYAPVLVPGLLQTRGYAAALIDEGDMVARRLDRQHLMTRAESPVDFTAVIDESVLHRPIGGRAVLAGQLRHIATEVDRPNISVRVLPYTAPRQPAYWGAFSVLRFPWRGGTVYLEHTDGSHSLDGEHDIENHEATFDRLLDLALPEAASRDLITTQASSIERQHP